MALIGDPNYDGDDSWVRKSEELEDVDMNGFATYLMVEKKLAPGSAKAYLGYVQTHSFLTFGRHMGRPKGLDSVLRRCHIGLSKLSGHVVSRKKAVLTHQVVGILASLKQALGGHPRSEMPLGGHPAGIPRLVHEVRVLGHV